MARPWSARCYGVARQREGSRQNSIGGESAAFARRTPNSDIGDHQAYFVRPASGAFQMWSLDSYNDPFPTSEPTMRRRNFERYPTREEGGTKSSPEAGLLLVIIMNLRTTAI
jgi:hypothetical protein